MTSEIETLARALYALEDNTVVSIEFTVEGVDIYCGDCKATGNTLLGALFTAVRLSAQSLGDAK